MKHLHIILTNVVYFTGCFIILTNVAYSTGCFVYVVCIITSKLRQRNDILFLLPTPMQ